MSSNGDTLVVQATSNGHDEIVGKFIETIGKLLLF